MRPTTAIVALAIGILLAGPGLAQTSDATGEDPGEQARRVLQDGGYQVTLPLERQPVAPTIPVALGSLLLWGALALVLIVAAVLLARELGFGDRASLGASESTGNAPLLDPERALSDPDRLAGEGRFDEAVHMLLLAAIRRLSAETERKPRASSTARELIGVFPLERERRASFAALVRTVEWSLFGGRPVSADDYGRCRDTFRALVGP